MGLISTLAGIGGLMRDTSGLAEVLRGNKMHEAEAEHEEYLAALAQLGREFEQAQTSWFDRAVNGLNRIPRPALAFGTIGLFVHAMYDPIGFAARMQGLVLVPDQLWWLLGAVVSFYFGARELHHFRDGRPNVSIDDLTAVAEAQKRILSLRPEEEAVFMDDDPQINAAGFGGFRWPWQKRPTPPKRPVAGNPANPGYNAALEEWRAAQG